MSGFYMKSVVGIVAGVTGGNVHDFVSVNQVEMRIRELNATESELLQALELVQMEKQVLEMHLNKGN